MTLEELIEHHRAQAVHFAPFGAQNVLTTFHMDAVKALEQTVAALREAHAEHFALAAHQCLFTDGRGLTGDEYGHQYCAKQAEVERLRQQLGQPLETERENKRLRALLQDARDYPGDPYVAARIDAELGEKP